MINDAYSMGDLMRVATRRAEQLGVTLKWGDPNEAPSCTKEKVITFPTVNLPMDEAAAINLRGATIHEPLHLVRSETFDLIEAKGDAVTPNYMMIWNLLEDAVMEREHCARYYGDKVDLGRSLNLHVTNHIAKLGASPPLVGDAVTFAALLGLYLHSRLPWDTIGTSQYYPFMSALGADAKGLAEKLIKEGWCDKMDAAVTPKDVESLAEELYKRLYPTQESDVSASKQPPDGGLNPVEFMPSPMNGDNVVEAEYEEREWGDRWTPSTNIKEMTNWNPVHRASREYFDTDITSQGFANQVRRHIQTMTRSKPLFERKTGKIHNSNLYRVAVPNVVGDWNTRIFKKKQDGLDIDTCISILVDWSGSMNDADKKPTAVRAAQRLVKTFDKALHIPVEVISFTVPHGFVFMHGVVKRFDERVTDTQIAQRFTEFDEQTGGNADADAVLYTAKRLALRQEKRKILIVLSDGEPTDSADGDPAFGLQQVVDSIKKRGQIELYGIGIMDDGVKEFYGKNASVIRNVNQLNTELLRILKEGVEHG